MSTPSNREESSSGVWSAGGISLTAPEDQLPAAALLEVSHQLESLLVGEWIAGEVTRWLVVGLGAVGVSPSIKLPKGNVEPSRHAGHRAQDYPANATG